MGAWRRIIGREGGAAALEACILRLQCRIFGAPASTLESAIFFNTRCSRLHQQLPSWSFDPNRPSLPGTSSRSFFQMFLASHRMMSTSGAGAAAAAQASETETLSEVTSKVQSQPESESQARKPPDPRPKSIRGSPVSWTSFILLLVTGVALLFYFDREKKRRVEALKNMEVDVKYGPSVGKAAIGGPFKLVNHEGKVVTEKDFMGNWTLMYFGFTSCPDICPDELQKMVQAIDMIEKKSGMKIAPLFVSVDPERDTVEQMREYVQEFHPRLIGLTGTPEVIKEVAKAYRVYYMKTGDEGDDYLVDHSIIMYLMDPNMDFVKFFGKNYTVDELADGILKEIKEHE